MKVLMIDDEAPIVAMYQEKLSAEGFTVVSAPDCQTGIEMAKTEKPDVILLDIIMPKTNGLDGLKLLKEKKETKDIPVYLLTNIPQDLYGNKGDKFGAAGYIFKAETEPKELVKILRNVNPPAEADEE